MRQNRPRGATLIEMMIVVVVVGMLATVSYWGFQGTVPRYRVRSAASQAHADLVLARAQAIAQNRNHFVRFAASAYEVIRDADGNGAISAGDPTVKRVDLPSGVTYYRPTPGLGPVADAVKFDGRGLAPDIAPNGWGIGFQNAGTDRRVVTVRYSGLVKID